MSITSIQNLTEKSNTENRIFGSVLIPNKLIYRNPNKSVGEPHYIRFSESIIEELRIRFHENNFDKNVNINHDGIHVKGVSISKSFIVTEENMHDLPLEFKHLPKGTWMVEYIVDNEDIWEMIKDKKLNGFSIEGLFGYGEKINN
jgi:hypothetical protein